MSFHDRLLSSASYLETKAEGDPPDVAAALAALQSSMEEKITGLKSEVKSATDRADALEIRMNRPEFKREQKSEPTVEQKAFDKFLRGGQERLSADEIKSLRISDDTAGGYLAPDVFIAELLRNVVLFSPVRNVARVMPIGGPAALLPKRTGGMTGQWVGDTETRPATTVTFGQNRYPVGEYAAYCDVANSMLEDSAFDVAAELSFEFAEEFGRGEGAAFVNGNSVLSPSGFMLDPNVTYTPGGDANLVTADGLIDLYHALKTPYRANAVWGMNSATLGAVRKLKITTGQYLLATVGIDNAPIATLMGRPIVEMPDMPDVAANAYPIVFGNFNQGYRIFDRVALSILRDPYSQATNGMTRFHGRRRVAGGTGKPEALRKLKIATS